ncbi:coiled-coil domain-containing protein 92-like isoform X2 [Littorina saxatilis]|uniref:CCDC92/74 N-terminal domain-containing protein n=1 Tax=Littorina saxatilis TaxID=31220 RepID=A0AAN9AJL7_9CAEN
MEAAVHKRNMESSILFMQQEHSDTLKALHEEIHKLQKRCTDLTFQLTMHGIRLDEEGDIDSRLKEVQHQLQESQSNENVLESQLSERDQRQHKAEQELRAMKKRHLDEMRNAAQSISSLKAEVEAKSNNIAFLTTELHRLKVKQKMEMPGQGGVTEATIIRRTQPKYMPTPPRDMLTNSARIRHRGAHTITQPSVQRGGPIASASNTSISSDGDLIARTLPVASAYARSSGSESPDISSFVQREIGVVEVKKPAPLPPINPGLGERDLRLGEHDVRQVVISKHTHRGRSRPRPSTPEKRPWLERKACGMHIQRSKMHPRGS